MNKKVFKRIDLTCMLQEGIKQEDIVLSGMLSYKEDGKFLFQQAIPRRRDIRNNRLYEGKFVNIVRRKDGCYYPFLKSFKLEDIEDRGEFAHRIYSEITEALFSIE